MFGIILWVTIACVVTGAWFWLFIEALDGSWLAGVLAFVVFVFGVSWLIYAIAQEEDTGPCLRYETSYIMVNKVMTPYRYCVERGEWIKE